jgi:hypothetical protein
MTLKSRVGALDGADSGVLRLAVEVTGSGRRTSRPRRSLTCSSEAAWEGCTWGVSEPHGDNPQGHWLVEGRGNRRLGFVKSLDKGVIINLPRGHWDQIRQSLPVSRGLDVRRSCITGVDSGPDGTAGGGPFRTYSTHNFGQRGFHRPREPQQERVQQPNNAT